MNTAIKTLTEQLQDASNLTAQVNAAEELSQLAEEAQPAMVALVQHCGASDENLQNLCVGALESIGPPASEQIDDLALLASSADINVAFWAVTLLGRAGSLAISATGVLSTRANDDSTPQVQKRAARALNKIQSA